MAVQVNKYVSNDGELDGELFDTMEAAEARDMELELGEQAKEFIATLGLKKGSGVLYERIMKWETFKREQSNDSEQ